MRTLKPYKYTKTYLNSPELLWAKASEYFQSVDEYNKTANKPHPYSQTALAKFIGISYNTWQENKKNLQAYSDFVIVIKRIEKVIEVNQLNGAIVGIFPECILNNYFKRKGL